MRSRIARIIFIGADTLVVSLIFIAAFTNAFTVNLALWNTGFRKLIFYTVDSNLLAAIALFITLPYKFRRIKNGKPLPHFCVLLSFVGVVSTTVTFMTVLLFLGPTMGYGEMYLGNNYIMHLLCPVLAVLSFVFDITSGKRMKFREVSFCVIPTAVYAIVYFIMVMIIGKDNGGWDDFYGFNAGGFWYISAVVIIGFSYIIGILLWLAHRPAEKRALSCA